MAFSFQINRPENISEALVRVAGKIQSGGGMFSGDEQSGSFTGRGVSGRYDVGNKITITITQKPILASNSKVIDTITGYFSQN